MTIEQWLSDATKKLHHAEVSSARLDAELLLAFGVKKPREYLLAHPEIIFKGRPLENVNRWLERRVKWEPLAYILGEKEFYGRMFMVTPDVLIPRPESETMIDLLKQIEEYEIGNRKYGELQIIDIGTGSGCLAITAKLEWSNAKVIAIDTSKKALAVARKNARVHQADITFIHGSLLEPLPLTTYHLPLTVILANLPYVDKNWEVSPETASEPQQALFASDGGLELIKKLIIQAAGKLQKQGYLLLEADPRQHDAIIVFAKDYELRHKKTDGFILMLQLA